MGHSNEKALTSIIKKWILGQNILKRIFGDKKIEDPYKKYIAGSTYIVPSCTLLAYQYIDGHNVPVQDQTVWVIDKYDDGYFFGKTYAALNGHPITEFNMSGSITPFGDVYITFFPLSSSDNNVITGIGKFVITKCGGYFIMQMNSADSQNGGLSHWSYMVSVKPDDYWYQHLPSVDQSVPEFIDSFNK